MAFASLRLALWRKSTIPARYLLGTMAARDERFRQWSGAKTDQALPRPAAAAGSSTSPTMPTSASSPPPATASARPTATRRPGPADPQDEPRRHHLVPLQWLGHRRRVRRRLAAADSLHDARSEHRRPDRALHPPRRRRLRQAQLPPGCADQRGRRHRRQRRAGRRATGPHRALRRYRARARRQRADLLPRATTIRRSRASRKETPAGWPAASTPTPTSATTRSSTSTRAGWSGPARSARATRPPTASATACRPTATATTEKR